MIEKPLFIVARQKIKYLEINDTKIYMEKQACRNRKTLKKKNCEYGLSQSNIKTLCRASRITTAWSWMIKTNSH